MAAPRKKPAVAAVLYGAKLRALGVRDEFLKPAKYVVAIAASSEASPKNAATEDWLENELTPDGQSEFSVKTSIFVTRSLALVVITEPVEEITRSMGIEDIVCTPNRLGLQLETR